ncbi:unnamed protein product [Brassica oleracea var. botrytis]
MEYEQDQPYIDHDKEITQEDAWTVISAYFVEKGLVRQQIDSFDIVDESCDIEIRPESQSDFVEVL